eukprot:753088-Hanusia_phi.AAC.1
MSPVSQSGHSGTQRPLGGLRGAVGPAGRPGRAGPAGPVFRVPAELRNTSWKSDREFGTAKAAPVPSQPTQPSCVAAPGAARRAQ